VFRGLGTTICREIPGFGTYFYSYELMTRTSGNNGEPGPPIGTFHMMLAGGLSGTVSWVLTYPIDVIKSRLQADGCNGVYKYTGFMDCLKKSVASEGYGVLTRGLNSTILRAFPTNAATFTVVTWIFRWANANHLDDNEAYIIPHVVDIPTQEYVPAMVKRSVDPGFGCKVFGLKEKTEFKENYVNSIFNWRRTMLHNIVSGSNFGAFHLFAKSTQMHSLANDEESHAMPENAENVHPFKVDVAYCDNCLTAETEATQNEEETQPDNPPNDEKETSTYEHKNDYYISSVR
jgi:Mitochondrial carrier protein.